MTPAAIIQQVQAEGVILVVSSAGTIKATGDGTAVNRWLTVIREHKAALLEYLSQHPVNDAHGLVSQFMEDGLSLEEAQSLAAVSVQPRPVEEWLAMIHELDNLIECYCITFKLREETKRRIIETRCRQPLAAIPETLAWFRQALADHQ